MQQSEIGERRPQAARYWAHTDGQAFDIEPLRDLGAEFIDEVRRLVRAELSLARREMRGELKKAGAGAGIAGAGGALMYVAAFCLAATLIALLALAMPVWVAALLTTIAFGVAGYLLVKAGRERIRHVQLNRTRNELQEDAEWLRQTTRAVKARRHANA